MIGLKNAAVVGARRADDVPRPLHTLHRWLVVTGFVVGGAVAVHGVLTMGVTFFAGPVIIGLVWGITRDPRQRLRAMVAVPLAFPTLVVFAFLLGHLGASEVVGVPILTAAMIVLLVGIGQVLAWLMGSRRGRCVAAATGRVTGKAAIGGLGALGELANGKCSSPVDLDDHTHPEQSPDNPEHYCDQWHGPSSDDWRG